jgi:hypothetical protein
MITINSTAKTVISLLYLAQILYRHVTAANSTEIEEVHLVSKRSDTNILTQWTLTVRIRIVEFQFVSPCAFFSVREYLVSDFGSEYRPTQNFNCSFVVISLSFNHLTQNGHFSGRTAPLTTRRYILYIYSTNICTEYSKHAAYSPFFPLQNAVYFIMLLFWFLYYSHFIYRLC